jgi:hypothetical protein
MIRFKTHQLILMIGLIAPLPSYAAYCIKVGGGFGSGGTSFVGPGFSLPAAGACKAWAGFLKTASSVIANSTGAGCLSSDGKVLTLTIISTDPGYFGVGVTATDHIRFCPAGNTGCPIGAGQAIGTHSGSAAKQSCTTSLLNLPAIHD